MQRPRAPRPVPKDDFTVPGHNRIGFGTHMLLSDANCTVMKPSWDGKETVFRPYPSLDHEDPNKFYPYRIDPGGRNYFGHWIKRYDVAWSVGNPATTFLIRHDPAYGSVYDPWQTPLGMLYSTVERKCKAGQGRQEWYQCREGSAGRGKSLRPPSECVLMQGVVFRHDSNDLFQGRCPPGWGTEKPVIFVLSSGLAKTFVNHLNAEVENFRGDPADFESRYIHGDPVGLEHGRFFHFFEKGNDPRHRYQARPSVAGSLPTSSSSWGGGSSGGGGGDGELKGFDMFVAKELGGLNPCFNNPDQIEMVKEKWRFWEDVLYFPTYMEQAHMLSHSFPPSAIIEAFEGHPDWIPDDVRRTATGAVSASVPAAPPAGMPIGAPAFSGPSFQPAGGSSAGGLPAGDSLWAPKPGTGQPAVKTPAAAASFLPVAPQAVQDGVVPSDSITDEPDAPGTAPAFSGFEPPPVAPPATPADNKDRTADSLARLAAARAGNKK